ncbi:hypothetical protein CDQ92_10665 [Sphingopyxis bauzanensis]|uniref:Uncharacterized protein n=1 Tax=Sphingopyxis bauzanensis TaxID=651663 RepID=A0A246JWN6_9SPHN|nr:hypothetical protein CDQ92_10665 [Sphingopyxis bauzanensis]
MLYVVEEPKLPPVCQRLEPYATDDTDGLVFRQVPHKTQFIEKVRRATLNCLFERRIVSFGG